MSSWAAIFDMDGVVVDTNALHKDAWRAFCHARGLSPSEADMERWVFGRTNKDILSFLLGPGLTRTELHNLAEEKESLFRKWAKGRLRPLAGLESLLADLAKAGVGLAVATSAPSGNVDCVMAETGLAHRFQHIVDAAAVERSKPEPDIYLEAAGRLGMAPSRCLVFEDSLSGIEAARRAGMTVVGLATTHGLEELAPRTRLAVKDFRGLDAERLAALLPGKG